MLYEAIRGLKVDASDIIVAILRQHEDTLGASDGIRRMLGEEVSVLVFEEPTRSQSETVFKMLERAQVEEPFLVKDSDNVFCVDGIEQDFNYICIESLNSFEEINPRNKSYVKVDSNKLITAIKEKVVISDCFCVGGYYFTDPKAFCQTYQTLVSQFVDGAKELYISDIIGAMLLKDIPFLTKKVQGYVDWGTAHEWYNFNKRFRTYFVNLDGVVFEFGSPFFHPTYSEVKPNLEVVSELLKLQEEGNQIVFISERNESWREETEAALSALDFKSFILIMGCRSTQHVLVNACLSQSPYPSARAVNLFGSEEIGSRLRELL